VWLGLWVVLVEPSPKLHDQLVTLPVEASVKVTARGAVPLVGLALNLATGAVAAGLTVIVPVALLDPPELVTVSVTVKVPALE
jgi:hypothetical protein